VSVLVINCNFKKINLIYYFDIILIALWMSFIFHKQRIADLLIVFDIFQNVYVL